MPACRAPDDRRLTFPAVTTSERDQLTPLYETTSIGYIDCAGWAVYNGYCAPIRHGHVDVVLGLGRYRYGFFARA